MLDLRGGSPLPDDLFADSGVVRKIEGRIDKYAPLLILGDNPELDTWEWLELDREQPEVATAGRLAGCPDGSLPPSVGSQLRVMDVFTQWNILFGRYLPGDKTMRIARTNCKWRVRGIVVLAGLWLCRLPWPIHRRAAQSPARRMTRRGETPPHPPRRFRRGCPPRSGRRRLGVTDQLNTMLSALPQVTLVNRDQIKKVADEHQMALSGLVDNAAAVKIGKFLSAQYVVVGRASKIGQTILSGAEDRGRGNHGADDRVGQGRRRKRLRSRAGTAG